MPAAHLAPPLPTRSPALVLLLLLMGSAASAADKAAPPPAKADGSSIGDNIRSLGRQLTDPATLSRIKGHEQELEKNVKAKRDRQRKDHGAFRASDAAELAKAPPPGGPAGGAPKAHGKAAGAPAHEARAAGARSAAAEAKPEASKAGKAKAPPATTGQKPAR